MAVTDDTLQDETTRLLAELVRFNTVNPPGNERPAIEHLERQAAAAGFTTEILGSSPERVNLIATLGDPQAGPTLVLLGHVDTVLAHAPDWTHDPWSGAVADGFLWGRGALDMKSQVAAEAVAGFSLAREGWRPHGALKLVFVADEETGGDLGAQWLTREHPEKVRCDYLLNEGAGGVFEYDGRRRYGVCVAEKGVFRFTLTAHGIAGHASVPRLGDNALLKLGPVLGRFAAAEVSFALTDGPAALLRGLGFDPSDPGAALAVLRERAPQLAVGVEAMLGVTFTPTMAHASDKVNVIPAHASIKVDCRVPPGLGEAVARERLAAVLGELGEQFTLEFNETVIGNQSPLDAPLMDALDRWVRDRDPGAETVPVILPGFSDSRWFRDAFPDCVAYGFFPQRHQSLLDSSPLVHNADERIDVRDLGFAARCYADIARELLS